MFELIHTSAKQGLIANRSGFCSVAWTEGIPSNLIAPIENLSSYQPLYAAHTPEAKLNPRVCIVFQEGEPCGKCAAACPTGAITLRKSSGAPKLNAALCIGCGACQRVCPASPEKAMTVHPIERQVTLENQNG